MAASITLKGLPETLRALRGVDARVIDIVPGAMFQVAEEIMTAAKEITPVLTGALRASGHVEAPVIQGSRVTVRLGFGGPAIPYALRQHEDLSYRHTVGQAHFLSIPFNAIGSKLDEHLAAAVRRVIAGLRR